MTRLSDTELIRLRMTQWGCSGTHRGPGTRECPADPHHHHDEKCHPPIAAFRALLDEVAEVRASRSSTSGRDAGFRDGVEAAIREVRSYSRETSIDMAQAASQAILARLRALSPVESPGEEGQTLEPVLGTYYAAPASPASDPRGTPIPLVMCACGHDHKACCGGPHGICEDFPRCPCREFRAPSTSPSETR